MLDALKFVQGAVGKERTTELTHFRIANHRITAANGVIALSSPIDIDLECWPKAEAMVNAIRACDDTIQMHLTPTKLLAIKSGNFRTLVPTLDRGAWLVEPEGVSVKPAGALLPAFEQLQEVMSTNPAHTWANGILLDKGSAFATNNVVLVEYWLGHHFPYRVNIPRAAVNEFLTIGQEPVEFLVTGNSLTFLYEGGRWLKTQLLDHRWPEKATELLEGMPPTDTQPPPTLFAELKRIARFVDGSGIVYLSKNEISTNQTQTTIEVPGLIHKGAFNLAMLRKLEGLADVIGFEEAPRPVPFYGKNIRGLIAPMRVPS